MGVITLRYFMFIDLIHDLLSHLDAKSCDKVRKHVESAVHNRAVVYLSHYVARLGVI